MSSIRVETTEHGLPHSTTGIVPGHVAVIRERAPDNTLILTFGAHGHLAGRR